MPKKIYFIFLPLFFLAIITLLAVTVIVLTNKRNSPLTVSGAEALLKEKYPQLKDYPSDSLPPKSIITEKTESGWYFAFVQNGSGRAILFAECYYIDSSGNSKNTGYYTTLVDEEGDGTDFSAKNCSLQNPQKKSCRLLTCHGLEPECGYSEPIACTEVYLSGDKCLKYAKCVETNHGCELSFSDEFNQCKACIMNCQQQYSGGVLQDFACEDACP